MFRSEEKEEVFNLVRKLIDRKAWELFELVPYLQIITNKRKYATMYITSNHEDITFNINLDDSGWNGFTYVAKHDEYSLTFKDAMYRQNAIEVHLTRVQGISESLKMAIFRLYDYEEYSGFYIYINIREPLGYTPCDIIPKRIPILKKYLIQILEVYDKIHGTEDETQLLNETIPTVIEYKLNRKTNIYELSYRDMPELFPIFELLGPTEELERKLKRTKRTDEVLEFDTNFVEIFYKKGTREVAPLLITIVDRNKGTVLDFYLCDASDNEYEECLTILTRYFLENGRPKLIYIRNFISYLYLSPFFQTLNIKFDIEVPLKQTSEAIEHLLNTEFKDFVHENVNGQHYDIDQDDQQDSYDGETRIV